MELADTQGSGSCARKGLRVRIPPRPPVVKRLQEILLKQDRFPGLTDFVLFLLPDRIAVRASHRGLFAVRARENRFDCGPAKCEVDIY